MKISKLFNLPFLPLMQKISHTAGMAARQINFLAGTCHPPFKAAIFTVKPAAESKLDVHKVFEIWLVAKGTGVLTYQHKKVSVKSGDVIYFDSFASHKITNTGKKTMQIFSIWWE
jgi:mannose-6-phosphate isomerase-like protein (cupin superfamily)